MATIACAIHINAASLCLSIPVWTRVTEIFALRDYYRGNNFSEGQGITIDFCEPPHVSKEEKNKQQSTYFERRSGVSF